MDIKCRICLQYREKMCSIFDKADTVTYSDMITSIADVKIRKEDKIITDKLCCSCCKKLTDAYNFKLSIERSDMELQKTANLKRFSFSNLNDIKIKIEIETDCKPLIPQMEYISNELFKDGADCVSYNNTVIKKIGNLSDDDSKTKSLSVVEFLNSIKTECDNDCDYDYGLEVDYKSDSGSNYSYDRKLTQSKNKKNKSKKNVKKQKKNPKQPKAIKPIYLEDVGIVRTEVIYKKKDKTKRQYTRTKPITVCPYCGKLTKSLDSHMLLHTAERTFKCDQCPKAFFKETVLNKHMTSHSLTRDFKCDRCIAAFHDKTQLNKHMIMHLDEKNFVCDICNKAFKTKPVMVRHKMTHNFGIKPIKCDLCSMTFNTKYSLRHHLRVHTGERPFKCEICSQPYSYKHDFNRHCLKKHGIFLKRRSVYVMNDEVLEKERALMRELALRAHGIIKGAIQDNPFDGPQGALAYEQAMKALEDNKIPISF